MSPELRRGRSRRECGELWKRGARQVLAATWVGGFRPLLLGSRGDTRRIAVLVGEIPCYSAFGRCYSEVENRLIRCSD